MSPPLPPPPPPLDSPNIDDVFSAITDIEPGIIPLLVRLPDGNCSQIDVPLSSTVEDIRSNIQGQSADIKLSFANELLQPDTPLLNTNIVDAYQHASSLLHTIATNNLDPDQKAAALDSACAVVESISNGVKDMEALCAAAAATTAPIPFLPPPSPNTASLLAQGQAEDERETPKVLNSDFKLLDSVLSNRKQKDKDKDPTTPAQLARGLSRRLPTLFPTDPQPSNQQQPSLSSQKSNLIIQPSISNIREARRKARQGRHETPNQSHPDHGSTAMTIGDSTNHIIDPPSDPAVASAARTTSGAVLTNSGKSTWLEDVMKTWEVGLVRESGVLAETKGGKEIDDYLEALEVEAQQEINLAQQAPTHPGDSEEEHDDDHDQPVAQDTTSDVRRSMASIALAEPSLDSPNPSPAQQMLTAQSAAMAILNANNVSSHPSPSHSSMSCHTSNSSYVGSTKTGPPARQATPIAPAPNVPASNGAPLYYPAVPLWKAPATTQKRRGRKRKNPELSEEDRALLRKEQNRESAKLSRVRRKVIAAEYEGKLSSLVNENTLLKKQVEGLNNRLGYLQSLLTVSVRHDTS